MLTRISAVPERGGVAGTDDVEVIHDGTNGLIRALSGVMQVQGTGTNATLVVGDGVVRGAANNVQDLGSSSQKWKDLYLAGAHIGTFIIRQSGGVAGTDEIQISHDGSNGLMSCKDGVMQVQGAGASATLVVQSGVVRPGTNNAQDLGSTSQKWKDLYLSGAARLDSTITPPGTTGNQTINKPAGRVNIAASGTTITVTNNLVTANSIVLVEKVTADATASVTSVVPGSGSFVINTAACTAETAFSFLVIN